MGKGSEEKEIYKYKGSLEGISQPFCGPDGIINMIIVIVITTRRPLPESLPAGSCFQEKELCQWPL